MNDIPALQTTQIKVTLPVQLQQFVQQRAGIYGLSMSTYIKHLILDDVRNLHTPTFAMHLDTEETADKALKEHTQGKTHEIANVDSFLQSL